MMKRLLIGAAALSGLYILCTRGRKNHPDLPKLRGWSYAHRGLHDESLPENSMAAFRAALENGYGIELDIHLIKDGTLAVIHDSSLKRTAGADIKVTDLTAQQLKQYPLNGTKETIPTFPEVLALFAGKAPLIIELKSDGNCEDLVDAAVHAMEGYEGTWCMESFDPRCVYVLKKKYPHILRGQLTEDYFKSPTSPLPGYLKWILKHQLLNFLTQPDFVAYNCRDLNTVSNTLVRKLWGMQGVTWTLKTRESYDRAAEDGWIPIFEGFRP